MGDSKENYQRDLGSYKVKEIEEGRGTLIRDGRFSNIMA